METVIGLVLVVAVAVLVLTIGRAAERGIESFDQERHEMFGAERLEGVDV